MWEQIASHIAEVTQQPFRMAQQRSVGGGCINRGTQIQDDRGQTYFVKLNSATQVEMFAAEALGLQQIQATGTIRVPTPLCWGATESSAYLVLEWLDLGSSSAAAWGQMGQNLALLHRKGISSQGFGWDRANTIGSTPQLNDWTPDWPTFFAEQRIGYQLKLGRRNGGHFPQGERLVEQIPHLLAGHDPAPSLVHGDLWSGNAGVMRSGEPVIYDPAPYYGDREVDLAMTELFGRFSPAFYEGYRAVWPLSPGYEKRKVLYNLYHILNHFNLFGGGYESQANQMIQLAR
jgi:fructosamine-3-kinase